MKVFVTKLSLLPIKCFLDNNVLNIDAHVWLPIHPINNVPFSLYTLSMSFRTVEFHISAIAYLLQHIQHWLLSPHWPLVHWEGRFFLDTYLLSANSCSDLSRLGTGNKRFTSSGSMCSAVFYIAQADSICACTLSNLAEFSLLWQ